MLLGITVIISICFVIHMICIFISSLSKGETYNQNIRICQGRPVGYSGTNTHHLMQDGSELETTTLARPSTGHVTSSLSSIYVQLCEIQSGREYSVYMEKELLIGRGLYVQGSAGIVLEDPMVSQKHCRIYRQGEQILLQDLGSKNHTWLNGCLVEGSMPLAFGDKIRIGQNIFRFQCYPQHREHIKYLHPSEPRHEATKTACPDRNREE